MEVSSKMRELTHAQAALRQANAEPALLQKHDTPGPVAGREGSED